MRFFRPALLTLGSLGAITLAFACVGDSSALVDGGLDATADVTTHDSGVDAAACNLAGPFGSKTVAGLGINAPGASQISFYPRSDELLAYLARNIPDSGKGFDLYSVDRPTKAAVYGNSTRLDVLNADSGADDFDPVISNDGTELFFARSPTPAFATVWTAVVSDAGYTAPSLVGVPVNGTFDRAEPTWLSPDGTTLYLNMANADAGLQDHIHVATRAGPGQGFTAIKAASALNGPTKDKNAVLTADSLTVFFASDRAGGSGYDVYTAARASTSVTFGAPAPVAEVNTSTDEWPVWISGDGCHLWMSDGNAIFVYSRP